MKTIPSTSNIKTLLLTAIFIFGILSVTTLQVFINPHPALAASDTYPAPWAPPATYDTVLDTWNEWNRECTSYAAWMLHSVNGFEMPFNDNASGWGTDATNKGYTVNMTPAVGSIYWTSSPQHVAWVESISSDGSTVTLQDYNHANTFVYDEYSIATSTASGYIHFKDINKPIGAWDGGSKTLPAVFRPSTGTWYYHASTGDVSQSYGLSGDIPTPGYYSGGSKPDYAVFRPSNSTWYFMPQGGSGNSQAFGSSGDVPVPGNYGGGSKTLPAVFRPSNSTWYWLTSSGTVTQAFGQSGDIPAPAFWDGGGKTEPGVFRPSTGTWYYLTPSGTVSQSYGLSGDTPEPSYYSGSTKPDYGVFRSSNSTWYFMPQGGSGNSQAFGSSGDIPVPGDYSGAIKTDYGVFRPSNTTWYWLPQGGSSNSQAFGSSGDIPAVSTLPYPILHSLGLL